MKRIADKLRKFYEFIAMNVMRDAYGLSIANDAAKLNGLSAFAQKQTGVRCGFGAVNKNHIVDVMIIGDWIFDRAGRFLGNGYDRAMINWPAVFDMLEDVVGLHLKMDAKRISELERQWSNDISIPCMCLYSDENDCVCGIIQGMYEFDANGELLGYFDGLDDLDEYPDEWEDEEDDEPDEDDDLDDEE